MARRSELAAIREVIAMLRRNPGGIRQPIAEKIIARTVSMSETRSSSGIVHHARMVRTSPIIANFLFRLLWFVFI